MRYRKNGIPLRTFVWRAGLIPVVFHQEHRGLKVILQVSTFFILVINNKLHFLFNHLPIGRRRLIEATIKLVNPFLCPLPTIEKKRVLIHASISLVKNEMPILTRFCSLRSGAHISRNRRAFRTWHN